MGHSRACRMRPAPGAGGHHGTRGCAAHIFSGKGGSEMKAAVYTVVIAAGIIVVSQFTLVATARAADAAPSNHPVPAAIRERNELPAAAPEQEDPAPAPGGGGSTEEDKRADCQLLLDVFPPPPRRNIANIPRVEQCLAVAEFCATPPHTF